jgi:predicted Zn finger-like uncharacterized protein
MAPIRVTCPSCAVTLKLLSVAPSGRNVKCPRCATVFMVAPPRAAEVSRPAVAPDAIRAPQPSRASPPRPARADDSDEQPRRPQRVSSRDPDEEEEEEDRRPRRRKKKKKQASKTPLILALAGGGTALLIAGVAVTLWLTGVFGGASGTGIGGEARGGGDNTEHAIRTRSFPDAGSSAVISKSQKMTMVMTLRDDAGNVLKQVNQDQTEEEEFTLTVLEAGAKWPKKFKQAYKTANETQGARVVPQPYQGRTVVFEDRGGRLHASSEGKPALPRPVLDSLSMKTTQTLLGAQLENMAWPERLRVGETKTLSPQAFVKQFALGAGGQIDIDEPQCRANAKLKDVATRNGKQFGVMDVNVTIVVRRIPPEMRFEPPATFDMTMNLDVVIDGSSTQGTMTGAGSLKGVAKMNQFGKQLSVDMTINVTMSETHSAETVLTKQPGPDKKN